jgi:hypothetical protein
VCCVLCAVCCVLCAVCAVCCVLCAVCCVLYGCIFDFGFCEKTVQCFVEVLVWKFPQHIVTLSSRCFCSFVLSLILVIDCFAYILHFL